MQAKYAFKGLLLNCPDVMFNVIEDPLIFKDDFTSLAKKFNVYAVNLWSDYNFIYNSTDIQRKCEKTIGLILSPACIEVGSNEIFSDLVGTYQGSEKSTRYLCRTNYGGWVINATY